jgi:DNA-binding LytR/AlgR family response regulator
MDNKVRILVVEDEMIIGARISMLLSNMGYEVTGLLARGEEVIIHLAENKPDIVLLDINLKGQMDGVETARLIMEMGNTAVIYLTANSDEATFNRAKLTKPAGFITKPFKQLDLQRAIELAISRMDADTNEAVKTAEAGEAEKPFLWLDRIFVRQKEKMVRVMLEDILFIEADRNYSRIFTRGREHLLAITLKTIEEKLPAESFLRIHRTYIINIAHVDEVTEKTVMIEKRIIPLSEGFREKLMLRLQKF